MANIHFKSVRKLIASGFTLAQSCKKLKINRKVFIDTLSQDEKVKLKELAKSKFSMFNRRNCNQNDLEIIEKMFLSGYTVKDICDQLKITRSSFYEFFTIEKHLKRI